LDTDYVINEAQSIASEFGLDLEIADITDNIVNLRLYIDVDFFVQIYANQPKNKLNLNPVFKSRRWFGHDCEGGRYHIHPFDNPKSHIFVDERADIREFVVKSLKLLEDSDLL